MVTEPEVVFEDEEAVGRSVTLPENRHEELSGMSVDGKCLRLESKLDDAVDNGEEELKCC